MKTYGIALFYSTQEAMKAEMVAQQAGFQVRIIPTPEKLIATCGFSLKYPLEEEDRVISLFSQEQINCEDFYHAVRDGLSITYEKIKK